MRKTHIVFILFTMFFLLSCATIPTSDRIGFDITFKNNTNMLACYLLYWFDHGFESQGPAAMCGGELQPGASNEVKNGYSPGTWAISWYDCRGGDWSFERPLYVTKNIRQITTTPIGDILK